MVLLSSSLALLSACDTIQSTEGVSVDTAEFAEVSLADIPQVEGSMGTYSDIGDWSVLVKSAGDLPDYLSTNVEDQGVIVNLVVKNNSETEQSLDFLEQLSLVSGTDVSGSGANMRLEYGNGITDETLRDASRIILEPGESWPLKFVFDVEASEAYTLVFQADSKSVEDGFLWVPVESKESRENY